MRKTFLMALLAALLLVSALSGCGGGGRPSVSQEIPVAGGTVTLGDKVTIYIPPGALSKSATVTIKEGTDDGQAPAPLDAALPIGGAFEIDLGGDELAKPATLEIAYDPDELPEGTPEGLVFLAYYDDEQEDWIPVVGEIDAERNVIVVQTDHLSWWNPFTWNWDAWIAVLNNVLTLNVTDFVEAVQLLTDDCPQNGQTVSVDSSKANNVIQGCVDGSESANPEVRVVNVKSFFFEVFSPNGGNEYPPAGVLGPGESLRFNLLTSEPPPLVFTAEINQRSGAYLITHLIIQMLPGLNQIGIQGSQIACITERIADLAPIAAAVESLVVEHDGAAAAEDLTRFLLDEDAVRRFITASDDCFYGAAATWSVEGIRQIGAATATIMSATDFVANYLLNYHSALAFNWTPPTPTPPPPTPAPVEPTGDTYAQHAVNLVLQGCIDDLSADGLQRNADGSFEGTLREWRGFAGSQGWPYKHWQISDINVVLARVHQLTPADRANGIEWGGTVAISFIGRLQNDDGTWSPWSDSQVSRTVRLIDGAWEVLPGPISYPSPIILDLPPYHDCTFDIIGYAPF